MLAAPQVVAHRLFRMAAAGATPSRADQREFHLMSAEKIAAFSESWQAMALHMCKVNQDLALSLVRTWPFPAAFAPPGAFPKPLSRAVAQLQGPALGILSKGIAPIHRHAVSNAKRLGRIKVR
jgi:hypothetical protein